MYTRISALHVYHVCNLYLELMIQSRNYNSARPLIFRHNLCNTHTIACLFFFWKYQFISMTSSFLYVMKLRRKQLSPDSRSYRSLFYGGLPLKTTSRVFKTYKYPSGYCQKVNGDMFGSLSGYNFEKLFPFQSSSNAKTPL